MTAKARNVHPRQDVAELLRAGATYVAIKAELGVSSHTISATRRALGIPTQEGGPGYRPSPKRRAEIERETVRLLEARASYSEITEQVGISAPTIARIRHAAGLPASGQSGARPARSVDEALVENLEAYGDGHSRWTGSWAGRMPQLCAERGKFNARRVVFERHHGRPPVGYIRSTCGQQLCMTGAHLTDSLRGNSMQDLLSQRRTRGASDDSMDAREQHLMTTHYEEAACAGEDLDLFFTGQRAAEAVAICRPCPIRAECLYDQLQQEANDSRYGVFGGLTASERRKLPALPRSRLAALAVLRRHLADLALPAQPKEKPVTVQALQNLLDEIDQQGGPQAARDNRLSLTSQETDVVTTTATTAAQGTADALPLAELLAWGDAHPDPDVQDQAARARAACTGLQQRHAADEELTSIATEREQLEKRLAELTARQAELAPARKPKRKASVQERDYDSRTVRAWAEATGVDCPRVGQIPKHVLDAWRAAHTSSGSGA